MSRKKQLLSWLASKESLLAEAFTSIGRDEKRFPHFAALSEERLCAAMQRECRGIFLFLSIDETGMHDVTEAHRHDAGDVFRSVPLQEQFDYLRARFDFFMHEVNSDASTEPFRDLLRQRLEIAAKYYQATSMVIAADQRLANLPDF